MGYLMSIDLGTSSIKTMLLKEEGTVIATKGAKYDVSIPQAGYAEQNPEMWYQKAIETIRSVLYESAINTSDIIAISFSGQMHGLVCVDKKGNPTRPAIIWLDQRSKQSIEHIQEKLGETYIADQIQNKIGTGFLLTSLYWMYENEREEYERVDKIMLPKDYIKLRLTGRIVTDYSDASGSLAFDNVSLCWAKELLEKISLSPDMFPVCRSSHEVIGTVCAEAAIQTGLPTSVKVVNGGADQCMQGIGNAIIEEGIFSANIGTGGQMATIVSSPLFDEKLRTNTFVHVIENRWNIMGGCLSSGASLKWLTQKIIGTEDFAEINREVATLPAGSEGLIFLPYLAGERTPHQDPNARGMFCGLTLKQGRYHMARAVMEGVTYSLKDCMNVILETGVKCKRVIASGGGANSKVWLQMQADILEQDIYKSASIEQACIGATITAGVGSKVYKSFEEACGVVVHMKKEVYHPIKENTKRYEAYYEEYKELYQNNKRLFKRLGKI